ncbi:MAG TPA: NRDE family protein [Alphaproteobacteria bacterium]|nr:NRDE family protein [Alphaproteobacteria bacterium]
MCSVVLLFRPGEPWPVLIAANRDEMLARAWKPPAAHWPDRPGVVAGLDELAGGSWLGVNREGVVAGILNRRHSLGPAQGVRSRGELVLEALDHGDAREAAAALAAIDGRSYRSFNLVIADNTGAYWLRNCGAEATGRVECFPLPPGYSMITAYDRNDRNSDRIRDYLPRFEAAAIPDPETGNWHAWQMLLASRGKDGREDGVESAMCVVTDYGFGTSSSSLLALPARERLDGKPIWLFASGRPGEAPYRPVAL